MNKIILKLLSKKKILITILSVAVVCVSIAGLKMYTSKGNYQDIIENNYPDFTEFIKELNKESVFTRHINSYPESVDVFRIAPRLRKFCMERSHFCIEFLQYLNQHPEKAEQIYNSAEPHKELVKFFSTFKWK